MNTRSIHVRLAIWHSLLITIAFIGFGAYCYVSFQNRLIEETQDALKRRILHLREDILPEILKNSPEILSRKIQGIYSPEENERFIRISQPASGVLYISGMPRENSFNPEKIPLPKDYTSDISERMKELRDSDNLLLEGFVTTINGVEYVLEMGSSTLPIQSALHRLIITLMIGLPVIILIAVIGGIALVRRALQPVEAMRASAEQISSNNLQQRLPVAETDDAIASLSRTLNQMLERLDTAYQQASRFSADASHELRTPLATMRSEIESIIHGYEIQDGIRECIGSILEEAENLSHIVEGLFSLARLDAGEAKLHNETFDLAELTRSTLEQMQLLAHEKNILVTVSANTLTLISGDSYRIKQVIVNLIDNAIKYTLPSGMIDIAVSSTTKSAFFTIKDNGIGISSEELPHIFERFYRSSNTRMQNIHGAGLGLSIIAAICQAHGGSVSATSIKGIGTTLIVELPLKIL